MKIVVAPNAFKDSLTAEQACSAIITRIRRVLPHTTLVSIPIADGGDGLLDVLHAALGGEMVKKTVTGPLFTKVEADFLYLPNQKTAVIEMARASGLAMLRPEERDAREATSLGTGELVLSAIEMGAKKILIGIGGSASNDGGMGFAAALGVKFLDADGKEVRLVGENLGKVATIDTSQIKNGVAEIEFEAVCDVDNPLTGEHGAAAIFGPQKGASQEDVKFLDAGLSSLAAKVREQFGQDYETMPGAGAAGGLGFGLAALFKARLRPGVDIVLDMVGIDKELGDADLCFTAEGCIDNQTAFGKGPAGVGIRSKRKGVPCLALAGGLSGDYSALHDMGINACFSLCKMPMSLDEAMKNGSDLLADVAEQALRAFLAAYKL